MFPQRLELKLDQRLIPRLELMFDLRLGKVSDPKLNQRLLCKFVLKLKLRLEFMLSSFRVFFFIAALSFLRGFR